jgi:hypothetical protein
MQRVIYQSDGISYEISVYEEEGGYRASWMCPVCGRTGGVPYASATTAEAIGRAKTHVMSEHHSQSHRAT